MVGYRLPVLLRCFAAVGGGLALAAAFEPVGLAWLMPPAIAVLVLVVRGLPLRRAWIVSLLFGVYLYAVDLILSAVNASIFEWAGS